MFNDLHLVVNRLQQSLRVITVSSASIQKNRTDNICGWRSAILLTPETHRNHYPEATIRIINPVLTLPFSDPQQQTLDQQIIYGNALMFACLC